MNQQTNGIDLNSFVADASRAFGGVELIIRPTSGQISLADAVQKRIDRLRADGQDDKAEDVTRTTVLLSATAKRLVDSLKSRTGLGLTGLLHQMLCTLDVLHDANSRGRYLVLADETRLMVPPQPETETVCKARRVTLISEPAAAAQGE